MKEFTVEENKPYSGSLDYKVDKEAIGKRLREAREAAGFSRDDVVLLDSVNISRTTLQQWEVGGREASIETVFTLARIYKTDPLEIISGVSAAKSSAINDDAEYAHVPFYRAEVSAGHGAFADSHTEPTHYLAFRKRWLKAHGFALKELIGLIARGDSMEPTIKDGAAVIINTANKDPADGNVYVIRVGDRLWIKRTQWLLDGSLRLNSDNSFYESMNLSQQDMAAENIEVIGQVVHTAYDLVR